MLPVYAVWMLICYCAPGHFHDPATAVSIILLALMMLFIVFIPKLYTINQQMKLEDSKDIFYSQQTSLNDSTLQSGSHSYGHHGPGGHHPAYGHPPPGHHGGHPGAGPPGHHFGGGKNGKHPRNGFYPTFSYATNYNYPRHPHAASFPRQRAGPHPNAMLHKGSKNKVKKIQKSRETLKYWLFLALFSGGRKPVHYIDRRLLFFSTDFSCQRATYIFKNIYFSTLKF